jgi:hypothetical protein
MSDRRWWPYRERSLLPPSERELWRRQGFVKNAVALEISFEALETPGVDGAKTRVSMRVEVLPFDMILPDDIQHLQLSKSPSDYS